MLKLVNVLEMSYDSVVEFINSFQTSECNKYLFMEARKSSKDYFNYAAGFDYNTYYLVDDDNPKYIIGFIDLHLYAIDFHKDYLYAGQIGYFVRSNERRKGYATKMLELMSSICEMMGINEICISCYKDNLASKKVIENNGGILDREFFDFDNNKEGLKYWIKLKPKLKDKIKYLKYVKEFNK